MGGMSGETEANVSGWTTDTLNNHVNRMFVEMDLRYEQRFKAQERAMEKAFEAAESATNRAFEAADKAVQAALAAQEKAVNKAETATEKRFEAVNEFRAQLADQAALFLPRKEYQVQHESLGEKVDAGHKVAMDAITDLRESRDTGAGRSVGQSALIASIIGAVAVLATVGGLIIAVTQ